MASRTMPVDKNDHMDTDLFKEAEDYLKLKMRNLFGLGSACGIAATAERARETVNKYTFEEEAIQLSWRMDPRTSQSDWIMVVKDGKQRQIYHIHKEILVHGERRSGLLLKLFEDIYKKGDPNQKNVTEVFVDSYSAPFIPLMLDYIYEDKLNLDVTVAPALRHLANQFDVRTLYALVSSFIQQDLSQKTVARYMEQADMAIDKELSGITVLVATQAFDIIPGDELGHIPPHLFQQMVSNKALNCPSAERLSQRIATYIRARVGNSMDVDHELFFFLTHANVIPSIHVDEALWFLNYAQENCPEVLDNESDGGYESTLQHRCSVVASKNWKKTLLAPVQFDIKRIKEGGARDGSENGDSTPYRLFRDDAEIDKSGQAYLNLPDNMKVEILEMALLESNMDHLQVDRENIFKKKQSRSEMTDSIHRMGSKDVREPTDKQPVWY